MSEDHETLERLQRTLLASAVAYWPSGTGPTMRAHRTTVSATVSARSPAVIALPPSAISAPASSRTLQINEMRAISFWQLRREPARVPAPVSRPDHNSRPHRRPHCEYRCCRDSITLLHGLTRGRSFRRVRNRPAIIPSAPTRKAAPRRYISLLRQYAMSSMPATPLRQRRPLPRRLYSAPGTCDVYHPNNKVILNGPGRTDLHCRQVYVQSKRQRRLRPLYQQCCGHGSGTGQRTPFLRVGTAHGATGAPATPRVRPPPLMSSSARPCTRWPVLTMCRKIHQHVRHHGQLLIRGLQPTEFQNPRMCGVFDFCLYRSLSCVVASTRSA